MKTFDNSKNFFDIFCNSEPQFDSNLTKNISYSQHENEDHCKIQQFPDHVIAAVDKLTQSYKDTSSKPYLFTCFQLLIRESAQPVHYGEVMKKF